MHASWTHLLSTLAGAVLTSALLTTWSSPSGLTQEQAEILSHLSLRHVPDGRGGTVETILVQGVNLQLVNGLGATETANGVGNLIVGYNELGNLHGDARIGSHNLVVGRGNSFAAWGGVIAGEDLLVSAPYGAAVGGIANVVSGDHAVAIGGNDTRAKGMASVVCGGAWGQAQGSYSVVNGGFVNVAGGEFATVAGGEANFATGQAAAVSGGHGNRAEGYRSTVGGGAGRIAPGAADWAAGTLFEDE